MEDDRTPWLLSGLWSKKGEFWLILAKNFELCLLQFLCSLERSVVVDLDSAFPIFCQRLFSVVEELSCIRIVVSLARAVFLVLV